MIGRLRGEIVSASGESLVIDVQGVGYEVFPSMGVREAAQESNELTVIIYTDVKENAISLFGFINELERQTFLLLKKVKGIGSRTALGIVSAVGAERLLSIIGRGDITALTKVPGVGKKTAERVIVELREQVGAIVSEVAEGVTLPKIQRVPLVEGPNEDAVLALEKLGFPSERARQAVESVVRGGVNGDAGEVVRHALAQL